MSERMGFAAMAPGGEVIQSSFHVEEADVFRNKHGDHRKHYESIGWRVIPAAKRGCRVAPLGSESAGKE